jgi:hypothetical protein
MVTVNVKTGAPEGYGLRGSPRDLEVGGLSETQVVTPSLMHKFYMLTCYRCPSPSSPGAYWCRHILNALQKGDEYYLVPSHDRILVPVMANTAELFVPVKLNLIDPFGEDENVSFSCTFSVVIPEDAHEKDLVCQVGPYDGEGYPLGLCTPRDGRKYYRTRIGQWLQTAYYQVSDCQGPYHAGQVFSAGWSRDLFNPTKFLRDTWSIICTGRCALCSSDDLVPDIDDPDRRYKTTTRRT